MAAQITGGVDTHLDVHVVAALDELGALAGVELFPTTTAGYQSLLGWLRSHGEVVVVGVEGTGSYGAGLARHLQHEGVAVVEVDRPNRQRRRRQGKSDSHDAVTAARAVQAGDALGAAKVRNGDVEAIRVLRVARGSAKRDRTRAINQMRSLVSTRPTICASNYADSRSPSWCARPRRSAPLSAATSPPPPVWRCALWRAGCSSSTPKSRPSTRS
jgi:transposase